MCTHKQEMIDYMVQELQDKLAAIEYLLSSFLIPIKIECSE